DVRYVDVQVFRGEKFTNKVRPLNKTDALTIKIFLKTNILFGILKTIDIHVVERKLPLIFLDNGKCGAVDYPDNTKTRRKSFGKGGLAGPEITLQCDDIARF